MKKTHDALDLAIVSLCGVILGCLIMAALAANKFEPRIAELQVMLIEQQNTCPESMKCYEPYGTGVEPEYILQGAIVQVDFVTAEDLPDDEDGYAEYVIDENGRFSWCRITAMMPERVLGDPQMDTLGHELLHCIIGDYHPQD